MLYTQSSPVSLMHPSLTTTTEDAATMPCKASHKRPRVHFAEQAPTSYYAVASSNDDDSNSWYHANELNHFKETARMESRLLRQQQQHNHTTTATTTSSFCYRGLEQRSSMDRQKNKYLAIRCILKAQKKCPEQMAAIAQRCTAWATELATLTGSQDFWEAYSPTSEATATTLLLPRVDSCPEFPFALRLKKRCVGDTGEPQEDRRVRRRISV